MPTYSGYTPDNTSDFFGIRLWYPSNTTFTFDTWGWQLEAGSVATAFQTATGTIQGELAACQRYYVRYNNSGNAFAQVTASGYATSTTNVDSFITFPVAMRTAPTSIDFANLRVVDAAVSVYTPSAVTVSSQGSNQIGYVSATITGGTAARFATLSQNNNTAGYLGFSAEL
jgi:hypothetical protein